MNEDPKTSKKAIFSLAAIILAVPGVMFFEGYSPTTYADPVGIPTVCYGETDKTITMRERFTKEECQVLLGVSLKKHADLVASCILVPLKDHEAAAVLSWSYNVGTSAACSSTLIKMVNSYVPPETWCQELRRWVYAKGKKLNGLVKRREAEYKMCVGE